jgi:hypothetical protein
MTIEERERYAEWFARARPLLDERKWRSAEGRAHTRPGAGAAPSAIHPVTPGHRGTHVVGGHQQSWPGANGRAQTEGDYSIRVLDVNTPINEMRVWHTHFDTTSATEDINVVYPIDRLTEWAEDGTIGHMALSKRALWETSDLF